MPFYSNIFISTSSLLFLYFQSWLLLLSPYSVGIQSLLIRHIYLYLVNCFLWFFTPTFFISSLTFLLLILSSIVFASYFPQFLIYTALVFSVIAYYLYTLFDLLSLFIRNIWRTIFFFYFSLPFLIFTWNYYFHPSSNFYVSISFCFILSYNINFLQYVFFVIVHSYNKIKNSYNFMSFFF